MSEQHVLGLPEENGLQILLQRANVDVGGGMQRTGRAAPTLEFCTAGEEVST
jgi:hypothetical protein